MKMKGKSIISCKKKKKSAKKKKKLKKTDEGGIRTHEPEGTGP
jgi:hypothetical protein